MIPFLLKRIGWGLLTVWVVFTLSFFLMRAAPGGPFDREKKLPPEIKKRIEAHYGMDKPLLVQYFDTLRKTFTWDLGPSLKVDDFSVNEIIAQGFPVSTSLGITALVYALVLGLSAGVISAIRRNGLLDVTVMTAATLGIAIPNFVLAGIMLMIFVFWLQWFPAAGWGSFQQLLLPAFCLGSPFAAYIARLTRTGMLEVLGQDYIRTAFAKGLAERRVVLRHAMRGAILPVVSYLGPATAGILTGSLVIEQIFNIPGMGSHFVKAAIDRDFPLAMGMVIIYTVLLFVMNTLVDISYSIIDPRVKLK